MADPFRLRVMKKLTALLAEISTEDSNSAETGYNFDLADKVFRGRNLFGDDAPLPMIAILETPIPLDQLPSPEEQPATNGFWDISIQGFVKDDKKNPTDEAYMLSADVIRKLAYERVKPARVRAATGKPGHIFDEPKVLDIVIGSPVHRPADEVSAKTYFWLNISLKVAENLYDPYQ